MQLILGNYIPISNKNIHKAIKMGKKEKKAKKSKSKKSKKHNKLSNEQAILFFRYYFFNLYSFKKMAF